MAEFTLFSSLLASLDLLFATSEDFLFSSLTVHNDTKGGSHIDTLLIVVIIEILARKITLVTVNKIDRELLIRRVAIDDRFVVRLFDST